MSRVLVKGGMVMTMNPSRQVHRDGCVLIEDGIIIYVGETAAAPVGNVDEVVDCGQRLIMPGLVNGHTHLCMIYGRTLGAELDLLSWLDLQLPLMAAFDEEAMYTAQLLGCVENLLNGNTTVVENFFSTHPANYSLADPALRAMRDSGIRGTLARAHEGRHFREDFVETMDEQADRLGELVARWHGSESGRLSVSMGPLLPWCVDEQMLRRTRRLADELGIALHMHVAESPEFNTLIRKHLKRDIRQVELLHETGCLGPDVQAVAVSDVSDREIELLAETRTGVVFDPQTRLFWGTGFPAIHRFHDAGLHSGLASNGPAANCGQDIFESMKYACATAKTAKSEPKALTRQRALSMATVEGARVLGKADTTGSLEVGKRADLISVDLQQPHLWPPFDVEAALVYSGRGADVRDVMVDGKLLIKDRNVLFVDQDALLAAALESASRCARKAGINVRKNQQQLSHGVFNGD